jgi:hypothetical protein
MHVLFDVPQLRLASGIPSDIAKVITGTQAIAELI